ncbi:MAG: phosphotransferase family protein [Candidatus Cryosericum sp.]
MDDCWERSSMFVELGRDAILRLVHCCDPRLIVEAVIPIREGCRGSAYRVQVAGGPLLLLKLFSTEDPPCAGEQQLQHLLRDEVPMPGLYFAGRDEALHGSFALYEFVGGTSLRDALHAGVRAGDELIERIGRSAAAIHQHMYTAVGFLDTGLNVKHHLPPATEWYSQFLGPRARARLGPELTAAVCNMVDAGTEEIEDMDNHPALVHGDFRPTNVMVDHQRLTGIVDWEFAMAGHPLSDVAQFFRYGEDFGERERRAFERGYRSIPGMQLPPEWERAGRLRDLANLLQMIDAKGERPRKDEDLRRLIAGIVVS